MAIRRTIPILFTIAFCILWVIPAAYGQNTQPQSISNHHTSLWAIGLEGGVMKLTEGAWDYSTYNEFGGLQIMRGLNPHWNLALSFR